MENSRKQYEEDAKRYRVQYEEAEKQSDTLRMKLGNIEERPRVVPKLNFEDHDLLRTVGRHVAMHINQAESDKRLAESGQFGAYNRLTAFLMHDLNNLIAQQLLVVENADRHRHNPKFVDDAIETIAHSVARMKRLMEQSADDLGPDLPTAEDYAAGRQVYRNRDK